MEKLKAILDGVVGQFVIDDGDIFRGQCTRLPKYFCQQCGINWQGKTGDGKNVIDTLVNTYGGYYGESAYGYRIASAEVKGNSNGHCWVELLVDGQWTIYEQNIPNAGTTTADFGEGVVYSVSKSNTPYKYAYNIRYAGSPIIDAFVMANTPEPTPEPQPEPEPTPEPTPEPDNKVYYTYSQGDTFGAVLKKLGLDEGNLWGVNGTVNYYTDQLWNTQPNVFDANGNIKIGVEFYLIPRK